MPYHLKVHYVGSRRSLLFIYLNDYSPQLRDCLFHYLIYIVNIKTLSLNFYIWPL